MAPIKIKRSTFDVGQKVILLGLVEVVNLIDEENGTLAEAMKFLCFLNDLLEIFDAGIDG